MSQQPPGLSASEVSGLLATLPNRRGILRLTRYYQKGSTKTVVYEVLDDNGNRLVDDQNRTVDIHTEYPPQLAELPVGTEFRIG